LIAISGVQNSYYGFDSYVLRILQPHKGVDKHADTRWFMRPQDSPAIALYWVQLPKEGSLEMRYGMIFQDAILGQDEIERRIAKFPVLKVRPDKLPVVEALSLDHLGRKMKELPLTIKFDSPSSPGAP
jgi:hypothetical protein